MPGVQVSRMVAQFLRLGYHLLIIPFRVHESSEAKGCPEICASPKLNKFHLLIHVCSSFMLNAHVLVVYLGTSRLGSREKRMGIPEYAYAFIFLSWIASVAVVKIKLCRGPVAFQRLLHCFNAVEKNSMLTQRQNLRVKWIQLAPALLSLHSVLEVLLDIFLVVLEVHQLGFTKGFENYVLSVQRASIEMGVDLEHNEAISSFIAATILCFGSAYNVLLDYFTHQFCLCVALAFYRLAQLSLQKGVNASFEHKAHLFRGLEVLSREINTTCGYFFLFRFINILPFYSYKLQAALAGNVATIAQVLMTLGPFSLISFLSARAHSLVQAELSKMSPAKDRILSMVPVVTPPDSEGSQNQLKVLKTFILLSASPIGIMGRVFLVTYSFVGSIAGLIITYSVVILQFRL